MIQNEQNRMIKNIMMKRIKDMKKMNMNTKIMEVKKVIKVPYLMKNIFRNTIEIINKITVIRIEYYNKKVLIIFTKLNN